MKTAKTSEEQEKLMLKYYKAKEDLAFGLQGLAYFCLSQPDGSIQIGESNRRNISILRDAEDSALKKATQKGITP